MSPAALSCPLLDVRPAPRVSRILATPIAAPAGKFQERFHPRAPLISSSVVAFSLSNSTDLQTPLRLLHNL
jgi:hypothetical protein